jgi:murein DD-endopeptidase MepM/ murein hydrolase activator NlpD
MEIAEHYLSLGSRLKFSPAVRRGLYYISTGLFVGLLAFVSVSVNRFVGDSMSITLVKPEYSNDELATSVQVSAKKGQTFSKILNAQQIPSEDIRAIISSLKKAGIATPVHIDQKITFGYDTHITESDEDLNTETRVLQQVTLKIDNVKRIEIVRDGLSFKAVELSVPLKRVLAKAHATINGSFMTTAKSLGIATNNIIELTNAYSHHIDFQRQIKSGDKITLVTEKFYTEAGEFSHHGKILYASMNLSGKDYKIYRYDPEGGDKTQYFSEDGKSAKRSLLRTPLNVVRISSRFGSRSHPVHGFTRMHKGVDFAAPMGTPIYAAGDGVVTEVARRSGYGRYIQIKHTPTLSTAYAHASAFAKDLRPGMRVKQGQVIAYVGRDGTATGPHLHYEVKIEGKHVNPLSVKNTPVPALAGLELKKFALFKQQLHKELEIEA